VQRKTITPDTLFKRDAPFVLSGRAVTAGPHRLDIERDGDGRESIVSKTVAMPRFIVCKSHRLLINIHIKAAIEKMRHVAIYTDSSVITNTPNHCDSHKIIEEQITSVW
jgi:hypothetical protein